MDKGFIPNQNTYKNLGQFRFWCQKVLPLVYDDSLSYYELLCKVVQYLNETIENIELVGDDMTKLYEAFTQLRYYADNYFANIDVQNEINEKLDSMVADGSLGVVIEHLFDEYKDEFNNAINTQQALINSLSGRMDNFTSLSQGSTTGDAEVIDIRVGVNGTKYANAGTAVREQLKERNITSETADIVPSLDIVPIEKVTREVVEVVETKAQEILQTIPEDYNKTCEDVRYLTQRTDGLAQEVNDMYVVFQNSVPKIDECSNKVDAMYDGYSDLVNKTNDMDNEINEISEYQITLSNQVVDISNECELLDNKISTLSRPNMLINGDFKVNQRLNTTYTGSGTNIYTVDRWRISLGTVTVNTDGSVTYINNSSSESDFTQVLETPIDVSNGYAVSVKVNDMTGSAKVKVGVGSEYQEKDLVVGENTLTNTSTEKLQSVSILLSPGSSVTLEWVKLEQGNYATPFIPRQYGEELLMCQRYYYQQTKVFGFGSVYEASVLFVMELPVVLRTTPTVIKEGIVRTLIEGVVSKQIQEISLSSFWGDKVYLILTVQTIWSSNGVGTMVRVYTDKDTDGFLALDAEIY